MKSLRRTVFQAAGVACLLAAGSSLAIHADDAPEADSPNGKARRVVDIQDVSIPINIGTVAGVDQDDPKDFMLGHSLRRAWAVKVASGNPRSPGATEGVVVVGSGRSNKIYGLDTVNGRRLWTATSKDSGISSISVDRKGAYYTTYSCTLERVDVVTGKIDFVEYLAPTVNCAPDVEGDRVAAAYSKDGNYNVSLHSADSGSRKWIESVATTVISAPVMHDGNVFVACTDGTMTSLDGKKGKEIWSTKAASLSAPVATKWGLLFATSWDGSSQPSAAGGKGEMTAEERKRWERQTTSSQDPSEYRTVVAAKDMRIAVLDDPAEKPADSSAAMPAGPNRHGLDYQGMRPGVSDSHVFFAHGGKLAAVDPLSAGASWEVNLTTRNTEFVQPISVEGLVIFTSTDGYVSAFEESSGALIWSYKLEGRSFKAAPCAHDGRVFLTSTQGELISLPLGSENFTLEKNSDDSSATAADTWWKVQKAFRHVREIIKDPAAADKLPGREVEDDEAENGNSPDARNTPAQPEDDAVRRDDDEPEEISKGEWERREERRANRTRPNGKPYEKKPYRRDR